MAGTSLRGETDWLIRFIPIIMIEKPSRFYKRTRIFPFSGLWKG
jgi:hypothetical protein